MVFCEFRPNLLIHGLLISLHRMGVFDGHSGSCAAEFLSGRILRNVNR